MPDPASINKIDYKQSTYKLFLGQTKDSLQKSIEINRDFEADNSASNKDSIQHDMNINEDLIMVTNPDTIEVLPALYFVFNKGILKRFECAIDYELQERSEQNIDAFLEVLKPYFDKLSFDSNRHILSQQLLLQFVNPNGEEKFSIDTAAKPNGILFIYETSAR